MTRSVAWKKLRSFPLETSISYNWPSFEPRQSEPSAIIGAPKMRPSVWYASDGLAAVGHIANGTFVNTDTQNFTANWSQIVVVGSQLLFYRASDGLEAIGHIANGKFENTDTQNFTDHWPHIIKI